MTEERSLRDRDDEEVGRAEGSGSPVNWRCGFAGVVAAVRATAWRRVES